MTQNRTNASTYTALIMENQVQYPAGKKCKPGSPATFRLAGANLEGVIRKESWTPSWPFECSPYDLQLSPQGTTLKIDANCAPGSYRFFPDVQAGGKAADSGVIRASSAPGGDIDVDDGEG